MIQKLLSAALCLAIAGVLAISSHSTAMAEKAAKTEKSAKQASSGELWTKRCDEPQGDAPANCEIFQRLVVKDTGQRVAELAVGFPPGKDARTASGVLILPLGILLESLEMQIDDQQKFSFKVRYCSNEGCIAFITLGGKLLDLMKKGNGLTVYTKTAEGKPLNIEMSLKGFGKALKDVGG